MDGYVLNVVMDHSTDTHVSVSSVIETWTDEEGRSWVVIPDELWETRETIEWQFGYPIWVTQYKH